MICIDYRVHVHPLWLTMGLLLNLFPSNEVCGYIPLFSSRFLSIYLAWIFMIPENMIFPFHGMLSLLLDLFHMLPWIYGFSANFSFSEGWHPFVWFSKRGANIFHVLYFEYSFTVSLVSCTWIISSFVFTKL